VAVTLQTYITQVQRLLHDPNATFWPIAELTDYINDGRNRIAQDTKCLRQLATNITLTQGQELYNVNETIAMATPAVGNVSVIDVLGITLYWGNSRYKLNYASFTELDARARAWQLYQDRPVLFTRMGALNVYLAPIPDQDYFTDWDVAILPPAMVNTTDTERIPPPFQDPVQYWAAFRAKFKEQALGESKIFKDEYARQGLMAQRAFMTRVIPNPYQR
jgi:hypothetical protein